MARPLRIEYDGALYHITSRGDGRDDIYLDEGDRALFLEVLSEVCERFKWICHTYCLMSNHYHFLIETPEGNVSRGMRQLNGVYTQRFNRKHGRVGHVFQGRYKAILVEKDSYLLELSRYIVLNPVRAGLVRSARDWPWSSYRATCGLMEPPDWLTIDWILSAFASRKSKAMESYKKFVADGKNQPSPWTFLKNQIYLGSEQFVERMQKQIEADKDLSEIPSLQRRAVAKPLSTYAQKTSDRQTAMVMAYNSGGYSMKEIGDYFGVHYSWVSKVIRKTKERVKT